MREVDWSYVNPAETYSPWKKTLKSIIVRGLYRKLIDYAVHCTQGLGRKLMLKTDLWVEALGMDEFKSIEQDFEVFGVELSKGTCAASKPAMKGKPIICASIRNLPFRSETFSALVDISTIDHVRYSEATHVVAEYARVLKHNGILLLCIDSKMSLPWEMYRKILLKYQAWSWLPKYVREIIRANDFEIMNRFYANTLFDSFTDMIWQSSGWSTGSRWTFRQEWNKVYALMAQYYAIVARKKDKNS